ncbi:MAG: oxidoreductase [Nocardia sp.]|uniref:NAD(P)/FAD-dependent oxidoreductase n=1 Tax=Nocardia sp. TaxID=1821 RepID=UPI0026216F04|nr:FAD-dependent oxidoreductase [Nocardia sp.]MCU1644341.1 oxidoreductase [Nocardia sp.]
MDSVVVVGAGLGGVSTAKALRTKGFRGTLTLLGDESEAPYDRPPLSKDVLLGTIDHQPLALDAERFGIDLRAGVEAVGLARAGDRWAVRCGNGEEIRADRVVIATGAHPIKLRALDAHPNVYSLRTLQDAHGLRGVLRRPMDVVVIGAGWIGAEVASAAAAIGCTVHVVDRETAPQSGTFGSEVGRRFLPWYGEAGVELLLGRQVVNTGARHIELDDGTVVPAEVIVSGVGVAPSTSWLNSASIELDRRGAVLVDRYLESISAPGVYAVGDCASYPTDRYSTRLRPEHWTNAQQSGAAAAANTLGHATAYDPVPYFWSKQFGRMLQYVGHHDHQDTLVWRSDPANPDWSAYWVRRGQPTAFLAVNRPREVVDVRRLLAQSAPFDLARLADEANPVATCVPEPSAR